MVKRLMNGLFIPVLVLGLASGCSAVLPLLTNDASQSPPQIRLPNTVGMLSAHGIEGEILNAVQLTEQRRFEEARDVLMSVRGRQPVNSEGYQALTCSIAIEALLSGDMETFRQHASELDRSLKEEMRVPQAYAEVIAIYRAAMGKSLPVNTPPKLRQWLQNLPVEPRPTVADKPTG